MMAEEKKKQLTVEERFTSFIAGERIVPGNSAPLTAKLLLNKIRKLDAEEGDIRYNIENELLDSQEIRKDLSAIMEAITTLTKLYNILIKGMEDIRDTVKERRVNGNQTATDTKQD